MAMNVEEQKVRLYLAKKARRGQTVSYTELNNALKLGLQFDLSCDRGELGHLLGEISSDEHEQGRPMLSSIALFKNASIPGQGFFDLAEFLGLPFIDKDVFWVDMLNRTFAFWKSDEGRKLIAEFEKELAGHIG